MTADEPSSADEPVEALYEEAPCGLLSCLPDGTITTVNRTVEDWTGRPRASLIGRPFTELLTAAGRIYHETHYAPLLRMQGVVREIAVEMLRADGSRLPVLLNSVLVTDAEGAERAIRTAIFDARDRRSYEQELLRARQREQEIASDLQRSLLGGELPASEEIAVEVLYRPAGVGLEAGGDWYDAFWLDPNRVLLVVGDVVGRGIGAAATMGQLRSAIRALALTGLGPGALLEALDRFAARHAIGRMTTVVCAIVSLDERQMTYATAGHPPSVTWGHDGRARLLEGGRSVPLDAAVTPTERPEARIDLTGIGGVLMYTDGLIERRERPLVAGLDELLDAVQATAPNVVPAQLARRLAGEAATDDLCVLAAALG